MASAASYALHTRLVLYEFQSSHCDPGEFAGGISITHSPDRSVFVLHGQDAFLQQKRCAELIDQLTGQACPEQGRGACPEQGRGACPERGRGDDANLAVAKFDATAELADIMDELRTAPLLAGRRIVIVRDSDAFVIEHAATLAKYLAAPAGAATLILMVNSWPPKTQRKDALEAIKALTKIVSQAGELINCSAPAAAALPKWISQSAETHGKKMAPQAARMLAEWIGADLARLDGEIRKLVLYVGDRKEISSADVSAVAVATGGYKPFALTNAIGNRDSRKALTILAAMLTNRGEEIKTLGMLAWHVRKTLARAGANAPSAAKARRDTRKLLAADLAIKSGADSATTMQLLVMELCT